MSDTGRRERAMMTIAALAGTMMLAFSAILIGGSLPSPGPWRAQGEAEPPSPAERPAATHSVSSTPRSTERPSGAREAPLPLATQNTHPSAPTSSPASSPARTKAMRSPGMVPPATPTESPDMSAAARPPVPGLIEATTAAPQPPRRTKKPKRPKKLIRSDTDLKEVGDSGRQQDDGF
ncbi:MULTISPECIES: hypothetical protein [Nonomuraea]|uniref:Uncharacterized protein n=1 Tax=Nonomuraea mangrovi TaxID=2316207 RepID=A0ABW4T1S4_9ACTN